MLPVRRDRAQQSSPWRLPSFLAVAVVLHLFLAPFLADLSGHRPGSSTRDTKPRRVKMVNMTGGAIQRPRLDAPALQAEQIKKKNDQERKKEETKKEEEKVDMAKVDGQIVDVPPSADNRPPEDAKYLSEYNTRAERETVSRHQSKDYGQAMNEPTIARKSPGPSSEQIGGNPNVLEIGPDQSKQDESAQKKEAQEAQAQAIEIPKISERDRLALKLDPSLGTLRNREDSEAMDGNSDRLRLSLGQEGSESQQPGRAPSPGRPVTDLIPQVGVLAKISGAPSNDALDELEEGEGTFLNSREFKFAGFFNRMKRGVSQHWNPVGEYRRRDPTGNIYGQLTRVTVLQVTLNADGKVKELTVTRSSGLDFLDNEAVQAFKRAEPFQNPPKGLVNGEGIISFPFAFSLEFRDGGLRLPF